MPGMATEQGHIDHAIDYIEISASDVAVAKRFYSAAFGWEFNDYGPGYAGIRGRGRDADGNANKEMGGLRQDPGVSGRTPLVVLYAADLDRTLASVRAAGGAIVKEPFTFPGGRRFHFTDPSGNELAVWSKT
jgi:predicted enzyme related to lactoylglutathione lyase